METRNKTNRKLDIGDRRKGLNRRVLEDRRTTDDRRSGTDRRSGWGKIEDHLLRGTLAAAASIVFQFSRPFTIILGYVDLLLNSSKEEHTKQKLVIVKEQLERISEILDDFREVDKFKTIDFDGLEILETNKLLKEEPNKLERKIL
jgi:signal transduction histidine kinase